MVVIGNAKYTPDRQSGGRNGTPALPMLPVESHFPTSSAKPPAHGY